MGCASRTLPPPASAPITAVREAPERKVAPKRPPKWRCEPWRFVYDRTVAKIGTSGMVSESYWLGCAKGVPSLGHLGTYRENLEEGVESSPLEYELTRDEWQELWNLVESL